ncbi:type III pantothenate kinase [Echinicola vietnamensis]|uniref:Type III pantothenate kinase n=1 Tax=Echinicola vietnamensis (strain DSM 17526 / LMG 23754 / KMM 6221) TaxID=926556 RepID=L0FWK2_ECHVK|nr:type III pantothenate kinase [Echinicola vietnamensis]AGA77131.1 pantothenate kinase, type III [Echinicola vietnamensis DSM 17526]
MKNLVIDIGNTRIKAALFHGEEQIEDCVETHLDELLLKVGLWEFDQVMVSSVRWSQEELEVMLPFGFLFLDRSVPLPVTNGYETPHTLGLDRIAAAIGAQGMAHGGPVLSIDLGTCITYDFIDDTHRYLGGAISPGVEMRFKAMHAQTAKLPLLEHIPSAEFPDLIGNNTASGMKSGVYHGVYFELEGAIARYQSHYQDLKVFICGGDAKFFESLTKDYIFVIPNLVLHGLNRILNYNVNTN